MATTIEKPMSISLWKYSIAGVLAGLITGILNNIWVVVYPAIFGHDVPGGVDPDTVTIMSFIPMIGAGIVYYLLSMNNISKGTKIYLILGTIAFIGSFVFPFFPAELGIFPAEEIPQGFATFTVPMHFIAAALALIFIPRFVSRSGAN